MRAKRIGWVLVCVLGLSMWPSLPSGVAAQSGTPSGELPFVTLVCQFAGDNSINGTISEIRPLYTERLPSFFSDISYGNLNITGDEVVGPFIIDNAKSYYDPPMSPDQAVFELVSDCMSKANTVDFTQYSGVHVLYNDAVELTGGTLGNLPATSQAGNSLFRFSLIPKVSWQSYRETALALGLALGMQPSGGPADNPGTLLVSPWDFMSGSGQTCNVVDPDYGCAPQGTIGVTLAETTGWVPDIHEEVVTAGSAREIRVTQLRGVATAVDRYVKIPLDSPANPADSELFYTVEVRQTVGVDQNAPATGVVIHQVDRQRAVPALVVDRDENGNLTDGGTVWTVGQTFTDVANNISIAVLADDDADPSTFDVYISNNGATPPAPPANLRADGVTLSTIKLDWDAASGNPDYRIYRLDLQDDGVQWVQREANVGTDLTYTDQALDCGTTYSYQVRSVTNDAESQWGDTLAVATEGCPGDTNGDGLITPVDVMYVVNRFGTDDPVADFVVDGVIDQADLDVVLENLGQSATD